MEDRGYRDISYADRLRAIYDKTSHTFGWASTMDYLSSLDGDDTATQVVCMIRWWKQLGILARPSDYRALIE